MGRPSGLALSVAAAAAARKPATAASVPVFLKNSRREIADINVSLLVETRCPHYSSRARMFLYLTEPAKPPDSPVGGHWNRTVHDDPDVFAGLATPEIELIAIPQVDAAVERARLVLAEIRLLVTELRRALGPRFGQHEIELELDVLELVSRRETAASLARRGRHAGNHAVLGLPASVLGIG